MVLDELDSGCEIRLVEFVRNVPSNRTKLPSLLNGCMEEGDNIKEWLPLQHVADVKLVLRDQSIGPLETRLDALRWLGGELDRCLEKVYRKLRVDLGRDPAPERVVDWLGGRDGVEQFVHVVKAQMAVLQQDPATFGHTLQYEAPGVHLLTLAH